MSVYPDKICHLQLNSRQIILFRLKSHHFRTYFLYMVRYNNVSRSVNDPTTPLQSPRSPAQNLGRVTPQPPGLTSEEGCKDIRARIFYNLYNRPTIIWLTQHSLWWTERQHAHPH